MRRLADLYADTWGAPPDSISRIGLSAASPRQYYRLQGPAGSVVGVVGTNVAENEAFLYLSRHFAEKGLAVPAIYAVSADRLCYLQQDLGTRSLYDAVHEGRQQGGAYSPREVALLREAIRALPKLQFRGAEDLDFSRCYPQATCDAQSVLFDLHYFKYCFLKATGIDFNEVRLEEEAQQMAQALSCVPLTAFMYRDFQARNILLDDDDTLFFIDYQGGRRGPCYYDVASFLWQASAHYSDTLRATLIDDYYSSLAEYAVTPPPKAAFLGTLQHFVLFRLLQVLGAYGFRGYFERKPYFLRSIPPAIANLRQLLAENTFPYPYLTSVLNALCTLPQYAEGGASAAKDSGELVVDVWSFAYKYGLPADTSGHGGGYIFDCRGTHNPGKYEQYREMTGMDAPVIRFLEDDGEIGTFLSSVYPLVDHHVSRYLRRAFTHLFIAFGCTGGQHRSVYCAEQVAHHLSEKLGVTVVVHHRELGIEQTLCATR